MIRFQYAIFSAAKGVTMSIIDPNRGTKPDKDSKKPRKDSSKPKKSKKKKSKKKKDKD